uniref:Uncharacterized protein n=1 Tax=viral metagenome TaxID=1070528 RepID=A0A6C0EAD0_9ZZZZ
MLLVLDTLIFFFINLERQQKNTSSSRYFNFFFINLESQQKNASSSRYFNFFY